MSRRLALLAGSLLLPVIVAALAASAGAAAQQDEDIAPVDVVIELRVWQHVDDADELWVSARPHGGDWDALGTVLLLLDSEHHSFAGVYRYGDLEVAGATLRIWQHGWETELISVCARRCTDPWVPTTRHPVGAIKLPLDDGQSPDGRYHYGDLKIATVPGNPGLLADRVQLLRLRDTLAGTGTLDWDHDTPMTTWTGVTTGGTRRRVTSISLADSGLTGQLSGLLGNLTGLEEVRLNGNALTGAIPSKVGQLRRLTHAYLGGNALTGCVPPSLHAAPNNDAASLGLPDCLPHLRTYSDGSTILSDGTYLLRQGESALILDVPTGIRITLEMVGFAHDNRYWLILEDVDSQSSTRLNLPLNNEWGRVIDPNAPETSAVFDRIMESMWLGAWDTPFRPSGDDSLPSEGPLAEGGRSVGPIAPAVAITLLGLLALAVARWRGRV